MTKEQIYDLIFQGDDVKWQSIIYELIREGKVDPWDIDVSILAKEYLDALRKLKQHNFRLSGKVVLAAAILLKMKTDRLGVEQLLSLTNPEDFPPEFEDEGDLVDIETEKHFTKAKLNLRIPGVRKRKVTVFELVDALKKALEVDEKRHARQSELAEMMRPRPINIIKVDVFSKIELVWKKLKEFVDKHKTRLLQFTQITPSKEKKDIIWTLIPLLHLAQQHKIELKQDVPFGEIFIDLANGSENLNLSKEEFDLDDGEKAATKEGEDKTHKNGNKT